MLGQALESGSNQKIAYVLDKQIIQSGFTNSVLSALKVMALTPEITRQHANVVHLTFEGYDEDPREVYEIPEIRSFVYKLHEQFPYWFHFLNKVDTSLLIVFFCLMDVTVDRKETGSVQIRLPDGGLSMVINDLFVAMNSLYDRHGLTSEENSRMTRLVKEYLNAYT